MTPYRLSFTFGGLLVPESRVMAAAFARSGDWAMARKSVIETSLLGKTRSTSVRRYTREIRARLEHAYKWELEALAGGALVPETNPRARLGRIRGPSR